MRRRSEAAAGRERYMHLLFASTKDQMLAHSVTLTEGGGANLMADALCSCLLEREAWHQSSKIRWQTDGKTPSVRVDLRSPILEAETTTLGFHFWRGGCALYKCIPESVLVALSICIVMHKKRL